MAIKIKRDNNFVYLGVTDLINDEEKKRADNIYRISGVKIQRLRVKLEREKNIDSLKFWYSIGKLVNKIIFDFKISDFEKRFFWLMLYDFLNSKVPERAKKFHIQNDFHVASILAKYDFNNLRKIGLWALWREILGSTKIMQDDRIADWVAKYIINKQIKTRNAARPILKFVRNRLKNLDTTILSQKELFLKLGEVEKIIKK